METVRIQQEHAMQQVHVDNLRGNEVLGMPVVSSGNVILYFAKNISKNCANLTFRMYTYAIMVRMRTEYTVLMRHIASQSVILRMCLKNTFTSITVICRRSR